MLQEQYPYWLAGEPIAPNADLEVTNKYSGETATRVALADAQAIDTAISAADDSFDATRAMPAYARQDVLNHCVRRFEERFDELADSLCIEAGKPIKDARGEVTRLIDTFRYAGEQAVRMTGEVMEMGISARAANYSGMWKRVPIGPCSFISPF
ncbi:MAG: aldehyde dehydrogenase family protein, partial [Myxococcota bacterium]|nr:aldehyde dehydrogenase family protein [Myxococcota bacterium]